MLVSQPGVEPAPFALKAVLTTGLPGKFPPSPFLTQQKGEISFLLDFIYLKRNRRKGMVCLMQGSKIENEIM